MPPAPHGMLYSFLVLPVESQAGSAPCQIYWPHLAQATQVASVNSDKRESSTPFYEHSLLNLSGSKIRQVLLSPDMLCSEELAFCVSPGFIQACVPPLVITGIQLCFFDGFLGTYIMARV